LVPINLYTVDHFFDYATRIEIKKHRSIENVLDNSTFLSLRESLESTKSDFKGIDVIGNLLYYQEVSKDIEEKLHRAIQREIGKYPKNILTFARLNTPTLNTEFRIHSDGVIRGQQPNLACVFYLRTDDSGTALFEHPVYGREWKGKSSNVHLIDDGQWKIYEEYKSKENSMFLYYSDLWHGRQPWIVEHDRIVIVSFMRI
jgi:hypothetical protein